MTRPLQLLWIALAAISVASAPAVARPTKVALTIDGDSELRRAVVGALDDSEVEIVSAKQTALAIERLGIGEVASERDAETLAAELDVETVVKGALDDQAHKLRFTIFKHGRKDGSFSVVVGGARSPVFRKAVRLKMLAKLAAADDDDTSARGTARQSKKPTEDGEDDRSTTHAAKAKKRAEKASDEVADGDKPTKGKKAKKAAEDAASDEVADGDKPTKGKKAKKAAEADAVADSDADAKHERKARHEEDDEGRHAVQVASEDGDPRDTADDDEPPSSEDARIEARADRSRGANLAAVRVDLGASMTGRSLKFKSTAFDKAPASYRAKPVAGGHVEAELYPLAAADRPGALAGLGIAAELDQAASFTVPGPDAATPLVTERHYSIGARFRLAFGHQPTSPTVTIGVGYGARTFAVDRSGGMTVDLPDVDYRMVDPGLAVRLPIGRRFAITAGGRALLLTSAGAIANPDQYGRANVIGGSASAGLELVFGSHLALRVVGEATQLGFTFYGEGMLATSRDGDPSTLDVRGAIDRYYGGAATLGLMY